MMKKTFTCALTIAGSDSGGGAGIQADLAVFTACGVHGTSAITCITAQNPKGVIGIQACRPEIVAQQIEAVAVELKPAAVKTGMLFSRDIIEVVARWRESNKRIPFVVDPVMVATSGARLLKPAAMTSMLSLLRSATLVMPNLQEAEIIANMQLENVEDLRVAARKIFKNYGCAALVKGGHLEGMREAIDIYFDGKEELLLSAPFIKGVSTHGTGCTYSAAVTAGLASGLSLGDAVLQAKEFISQAIANTRITSGHTVLNWTAAGNSFRGRKPGRTSGHGGGCSCC